MGGKWCQFPVISLRLGFRRNFCLYLHLRNFFGIRNPRMKLQTGEGTLDLPCSYKIDHELVAISKTDHLDRLTRRLRQSHDNAYQVLHCRIDVRKMSFFPRTVRDWNALPPDKASLNTLEAFKASICVQ